ncbi:hypothetical protein H310_02959 [Aphanomyces invadans]|uniref:PWI domain-containing protein n=2 Tax=Aphanomyces invadans TaxID=157072 RepID=A0A024UKH4_9STRA|nr:hypothetical protein H310_02959 [Aphanomyces invadans]ETW06809.1 hypothetical protein H310_02959 [Aphanomyces invadans]|eukprot:XP_008864884.1 hypothetical protein H310_02959 [Aphanomyces invadans]
MASGANFFRGTTLDQDSRFFNKHKKLLARMEFPACFKHKVDISKVNKEVMHQWITEKITQVLGFEDEIVVSTAINLLEPTHHLDPLDPKEMQVALTGFLEGDASSFMEELWNLLVSAQENPTGIPQVFLDKKKKEMEAKREKDAKDRERLAKRVEAFQPAPSNAKTSRFSDRRREGTERRHHGRSSSPLSRYRRSNPSPQRRQRSPSPKRGRTKSRRDASSSPDKKTSSVKSNSPKRRNDRTPSTPRAKSKKAQEASKSPNKVTPPQKSRHRPSSPPQTPVSRRPTRRSNTPPSRRRSTSPLDYQGIRHRSPSRERGGRHRSPSRERGSRYRSSSRERGSRRRSPSRDRKSPPRRRRRSRTPPRRSRPSRSPSKDEFQREKRPRRQDKDDDQGEGRRGH